MEYFGIIFIAIAIGVTLFALINWYEESIKRKTERWLEIQKMGWTLNDVKRNLEDLDYRNKYQLNALHAKLDRLASTQQESISKPNKKVTMSSDNDYTKDLEKRITDASFILMDWDGYYNPQTKQGNTVELANLIEEAYAALQGKSWRNN